MLLEDFRFYDLWGCRDSFILWILDFRTFGVLGILYSLGFMVFMLFGDLKTQCGFV